LKSRLKAWIKVEISLGMFPFKNHSLLVVPCLMHWFFY
jgi:hypothetical protein